MISGRDSGDGLLLPFVKIVSELSCEVLEGLAYGAEMAWDTVHMFGARYIHNSPERVLLREVIADFWQQAGSI